MKITMFRNPFMEVIKQRLPPAGVLQFAALLLQLAVAPCRTQGPPVDVSVVAGHTALLPCDITPPLAGDSVILVIWYRNQMKPIYSYDRRGPHREQAAHWHDKHVRSKLFFFRTITHPATLALETVEAQDAGEYRCRVDFEQSPTRNTRVRLYVIVPPQRPTIVDELGNQLSDRAGPYEEGSDLRLTCIVAGGPPLPTVRWWQGERQLESYEVPDAFPNVKRQQLIVRRISRADLHAVYTCRAFNNDITPPVNTSVSIDLLLPPVSVSILTNRQPLSAGRRYEIQCEASGSRPAARISWWLDSRALDTDGEEVSADGNVTVARIELTPEQSDNGRTLNCRANNPQLPTGVQEDTWNLQVYYAPTLKLQFGTGVNPDDIEEGDDVYFECIVHSNPPAYKVVWKHNGQPMMDDRKSGVVQVSQDLVLQAVRRQHAGNYTCIASNVEGDGESNTLELRVMFPPECHREQQHVYGVVRDETTYVRCEVDSYPAPVDIRWSFNLSGEPLQVPSARMRMDTTSFGAVSVLSYTPLAERDFGSLLCSAANTAGRQTEPCVFHVVPAGQPETPLNCSVLNRSTDSLEVDCEPGYDGGVRQHFLLEAYDEDSGALVANLSTIQEPHFFLERLNPGRRLKILVWAANARGRSESLAVNGSTLQMEKHTGDTLGPVAALSSLLEVAVGAVGALLLVTVTTAIVLCWRCKRTTNRGKGEGGGARRPRELPLKEKTMVVTGDLTAIVDERNPDIIPCSKDASFHPLGSTPASLHSPPALPPPPTGIRTPGNGAELAVETITDSRETLENSLNAHRLDEVAYARTRTLDIPESKPAPLTTFTGMMPATVLPSDPAMLPKAPTSAITNHMDHVVSGGMRLVRKAPSPGAPQLLPSPKEIVTVRAPLVFSSEQESCV